MDTIIRRYVFVLIIVCITYSQSWCITRHGLVIGLGQYQDRTWGTVHGDKDVPLVKNMLTVCGYNDIATLVNKNATKAGIISAFDGLSERCKKGDIVYIHFGFWIGEFLQGFLLSLLPAVYWFLCQRKGRSALV